MEPQTDFQLDIMTGLDTYSARQIRERIDANFTQGTQRAPLGAYFATGIKKTIEWYLENNTWCNRVKDGSYQGERLGLIQDV